MATLAHDRRDGDRESLLYALAAIHGNRGEFAAQRDLYAELARLAPAKPYYLTCLGDSCFRLGEVDTASEHHGRAIRLAHELAKAHCRKAGAPLTKLLFPKLVVCRAFGEMASKLDLFLKARALGWVPEGEPLLLAPMEQVANPCLLDYWRHHLNVLSAPAAIAEATTRFANSLFILDYYRPPDGPARERYLAAPMIQRLWETAERAPLLSLTDSHRDQGRAALAALGMAEDAWFVTLHIREPGYFGEDPETSPNRYRNGRIGNYLPAIRAVTEWGGWVMRLGDPSAEPLPAMERVIDMVRAKSRPDWLDVFLCAGCRFFAGMDSGPLYVAAAFGVPVLGTDWFVYGCWPTSRRDLFVPKRLIAEDGRPLTIAEWVQPAFYGNIGVKGYQRRGVRVVDAEPELIARAMGEMVDRLEGRAVYTADDEARQAAFRASGDPYGAGVNSRIGAAFLKAHPELLSVEK